MRRLTHNITRGVKMSGTVTDPVDVIITEDGDNIITEDGDDIITEDS